MRSGGDASPLSALDVTATEFLRNLTRLGLVNLLRAYGTSGLRKDAIARDRATLCPDLSEAVDLLCLSQPVPEAAAVAVLTEPMLEHMVDIGVAATGDETVQLPGIRLVDHLGSILFVAASQNNGYGYYGRDSIGLGRQLLGAGGRCLDLCCSTGCQTAVLAATAESVVSVEIDASLAPLFELNMCLNGVRSRVEPRWSDVREVEFDEPFDVVAVNAPMMPTFGVFDLPWLVDGGVDGAGLLKGILGRVPLAANGRLMATSMIPGNAAELQIDWLRGLAADRGWSVTVMPTDHEPLNADSAFVKASMVRLLGAPTDTAEVPDELLDAWAKAAIDRLYFSLIHITADCDDSTFRIVSTELQGERYSL